MADQLNGLAAACEWAEFGHVKVAAGQRVAACRLYGSKVQQLVKPEGWAWEKSLSASFGFVPSGAEQTLTKNDEKQRLETYSSPLTEHPVYIGRTKPPKG